MHKRILTLAALGLVTVAALPAAGSAQSHIDSRCEMRVAYGWPSSRCRASSDTEGQRLERQRVRAAALEAREGARASSASRIASLRFRNELRAIEHRERDAIQRSERAFAQAQVRQERAVERARARAERRSLYRTW